MEDLLPYFERELVLLRRYGQEFAARFPRVAGRLQGADDDPHVERLLQGVALLSARINKRLDDGQPQFTEALLEALFPHYLRPFPSCSIASFAPRQLPLAGTRTIAAGTELGATHGDSVRCRFRTAAPVTLAPVAIAAASFDPLIRAPTGTTLPPDATAALSITIAADALSDLPLDALRIHIDGDPSFAAALRDALLLHASRAFVQTDEGRWAKLPTVPITAAGFDGSEALIPAGPRTHPAWRLLTEYFCFPDKFRFVDIDLAALRPLLPAGCNSATLHLALSRLRPDGDAARMLRTLNAAHLRLFCAPVVNLFRRPGEPVAVTQMAADYAVQCHPTRPQAFEVYSVDEVSMLKHLPGGDKLTKFAPMYAPHHGDPEGGHYWVLRRDETLAAVSPGFESRLSLVDGSDDALAVERSTLSLALTCTNRDLPCRMRPGDPDGDLAVPDASDNPVVRLLARPSRPRRFPAGQAHWRLISHLSLNHRALLPDGLPGLRELLALHDLPQSPVSQRLIAGVVGLRHEETQAWVKHRRGASLVHGLEIHITVNEEAFVGSGIHLFAQVMDRFLGMYVQVNSFIELVLLSQRDNRELMRCARRSGTSALA